MIMKQYAVCFVWLGGPDWFNEPDYKIFGAVTPTDAKAQWVQYMLNKYGTGWTSVAEFSHVEEAPDQDDEAIERWPEFGYD